MSIAASISDYRLLAKKRLPRQLFDYIDGGSYQEQTLAENSNAFDELKLRQKVLRDVSNIDLSSSLLGTKASMPMAMAPVGLAGSFAHRGEVQALKSAEQANIPFCLSTVSICSMEEIANQASASFWYQLYMIRDRNVVKNLINRAKAVGCDTLIFTVDLPFPGARYRDSRNGLSGSNSLATKFSRLFDFVSHPKWLWDVGITGKPLVFGNLVDEVPNAKSMDDLQGWLISQFDPTTSWEDLAWVREQWSGKLIVKGIMDPEDAQQAVKVGVDGIIVSNHGGRQLDSVPASLAALPDIIQIVNGACNVLLDGGIRSGLDVVKAMGMGADGTLIGRPWVYGLGARGEQGVTDVLEIMRDEMRIGMALTGHTNFDSISQDIFC